MNTLVENCFLMSLLTGFIFFVAGLITYAFPPKKINHIYGYRTQKSMKNQNNWDFAQRFSSKKMAQGGLFLMFMSCSKMIVNTTETIDIVIGVISSISVVVYVLYSTENEIAKKEKSCQ